MKKIYLASSILLLALSSGVAYADTSSSSTSSTTREAIKERAAEKIQELKNRIASTSAQIKDVRKEARTEIENKIGKKLDKEREKIANAFEEAIKNLNKLADRVDGFMTKLEAKGNDLSSQRTLLADAKSKITIADTELTTLENMLASTTATTTRKALLKQIKVESGKVKADIKAAHKAIVAVITSLKPGREQEKVTSTSTVSTSTSSTSTSTASTTSN